MRRDNEILKLANLAAGQWGLFTTTQTRKLGFSAQRIARLAEYGTVERLRYGVYRISGGPCVPHEQILAAWLMIEPSVIASERLDAEYPAVVSHRSAARLHGLGDLDTRVIEFTTAGRKQSILADVRYRFARLDRDRWTLLDGLPVTTILTTIEDLAAEQQDTDTGHLASIVRDAITTNRIDTNTVIAALRPHAYKDGAMFGEGSILLDRFLTESGISIRRWHSWDPA